MIASFAIMEEGILTHKREVFKDRRPVIMNGFGNGTAMRTGMRFHFKEKKHGFLC